MKALLLFFPLLAHAALPLTLPEFQAQMRALFQKLPKQATAGVTFELLGSRKLLFARNDDRALIPASGAKLLTTAAALEKLGGGYTFRTRVFQQGDDLIVAGNGDPYLVSERLWLLAREVARAGVKKVNSVKIDNSAFSSDYRGLVEFQDTGEPFTAIVSATSLNFNSFELHVNPDPEGERPRLSLGPEDSALVTMKNEVKENGGAGHSVTVKSLGVTDGKEGLAVTGAIGKEAEPAIVYTIMAQPEAQVAAAFAALLRKEGVTVAHDFGGLANGAAQSAGVKQVAELESLPLQDLVRLLNTYSNNFMAEELFEALGAEALSPPASPEKSRQALGAFLAQHASCKDDVLDNGSGLSWVTRVSPRCFVDTLQSAYGEFRSFADLLGSLSEGGQTGSLKARFKRSSADFDPQKVHAKTGTLWSKQAVSSITGLTSTASGEAVVFSLIENDSRSDRGPLRELKEWEDECLELVQRLRL